MSLRSITKDELNGVLGEAIQAMPPLEFGGLVLTMHYCMFVEARAPFVTHEHQHPTYELTVHLGGVPLRNHIGQQVCTLSEEHRYTLLAFPPSLLHSRVQEDEGTSQILSFSFRLQGGDSHSRRVCRRIEKKLAEMGYEFPMTAVQREAVEALVTPPPPSLFRNEWLRAMIRCFVMDFLASPFAQFAQQPDMPEAGLENSIRNSILISLNSKPWTLADLGNAYNLSPRQLTRRFKAKFGTTIGRWDREARMQNARMLLETTENTVTDIAYTIGFPSLQAFTRFFHAHEGCSPSDFRARHRSQ